MRSNKKEDRIAVERLGTQGLDETSLEHLHRYAIAMQLAKGKKVLDIASGEGYGSALLSQQAEEVIGVDIDAESVKGASQKYVKSNLKYLTGSTSAIPLEDNCVDMVVSFETIEHHDEHDQMLREIKRVLKPDGLVLISSPDKKNYTDIPEHHNPFHIKELYREEFEELMKRNFANVHFMYQRFMTASIMTFSSDSNQNNGLEMFTGNFERIEKYQPEEHSVYITAIASAALLPEINPGVFYVDLKMREQMIHAIKTVQSSASFRTGNLLLRPLTLLKKIWNRNL